jgi:hypothetical protein
MTTQAVWVTVTLESYNGKGVHKLLRDGYLKSPRGMITFEHEIEEDVNIFDYLPKSLIFGDNTFTFSYKVVPAPK